MAKRRIELLAPARTADTGIQAILHGADAVYIGADGFGARKNAANSIADIARLVEFAHQYRARVYVTVNTIIFNHELDNVRRMICDLYRIGVDALIVQDPAILRMHIPPIALHASTQCDTRTPLKARFWQEVGMSQIVLARELTLGEIREICQAVTVPVEVFVHGALCVCYSGRCQASLSSGGRSANRGECAQICRLPWTLTDADGRVLANDSHLLSLRDLNLSGSIADLLDAGVSSFKIEGRLKDDAYVKNVTAFYRKAIDAEIARHPDLYERSSYGDSDPGFTPDIRKSFNRGFTTYFLRDRRQADISNPLTPKHMGEPVKDISELRNGDGISWFDKNGQYQGTYVNGFDRGRLLTSSPMTGADLHNLRRTYDHAFSRSLAAAHARRTIGISLTLDPTGITADDERGCHVRVEFSPTMSEARKPADRRAEMSRFGSTIYRVDSFTDLIGPNVFIPNSQLADGRCRIAKALDEAAADTYPFDYRREETSVPWPERSADYRDNINNHLASTFLREHGVSEIEDGADLNPSALEGQRVMTCRHCILREAGMCLKQAKPRFRMPLTISSGQRRFRLQFDCDRCEMSLIKI